MNSINICHILSFAINDVIKDSAHIQNVQKITAYCWENNKNFHEWQHYVNNIQYDIKH